MSTQLSQAQASQQGNRTSDGKYTFGTHSEPESLVLDPHSIHGPGGLLLQWSHSDVTEPEEYDLRKAALSQILAAAPQSQTGWRHASQQASDKLRSDSLEYRPYSHEWSVLRRTAASLDQHTASMLEPSVQAREIRAAIERGGRQCSHQHQEEFFNEGVLRHESAYAAAQEATIANPDLMHAVDAELRDYPEVLIHSGVAMVRVPGLEAPEDWGKAMAKDVAEQSVERLEREANYVRLDASFEELSTYMGSAEDDYIEAAKRLLPAGTQRYEEQMRRDHQLQPAGYQITQLSRGALAHERRVRVMDKAREQMPASSEIAYLDQLIADKIEPDDDTMYLLNQENGGWAGTAGIRSLYLIRLKMAEAGYNKA